jgi:hypothetical protein
MVVNIHDPSPLRGLTAAVGCPARDDDLVVDHCRLRAADLKTVEDRGGLLLLGTTAAKGQGQKVTAAVRYSPTRVDMIDELTATRSTISPSTKIITHDHPPDRDHGGPSEPLDGPTDQKISTAAKYSNDRTI